MIKKIAPLADRIILTQLQTGRAVKVADMGNYLKKIGYKAIITKNVRMSIARALELARAGDMICAAGSLYLIGELKQAFPELVSYDKKLQIE
jgi:dihydrofolate synthase/folylpolyglutamate synthase